MGMTDAEVEQHDKLNSIIETLNQDDKGNIVLIGDIMLDCYIHGYANNLNSKSTCPSPARNPPRRRCRRCCPRGKRTPINGLQWKTVWCSWG